MAELGITSNLVAFHLRVLEERGIVQRSRSQGDARRSYVQLIPSAFDRLGPAQVRIGGRILFVCTGNTARSQLAEAMWNSSASTIPAASAGTVPGSAVNPRTREVARRFRIPLPQDARPQPLSAVRQDGDFVVAVCDRAHERLAGDDDLHWSVPDPSPAGTPAAFEQVVSELRWRIAQAVPLLVAA